MGIHDGWPGGEGGEEEEGAYKTSSLMRPMYIHVDRQSG